MNELLDNVYVYLQKALRQYGFEVSKELSDFISKTVIYRSRGCTDKAYVSLNISHDWREESSWNYECRLGSGELDIENEPIELEFSSSSLVELGFLDKNECKELSQDLSGDDLAKLIDKIIEVSEGFLLGNTEFVLERRRNRNLQKIDSPFPPNSLEKALEINDFSEQEERRFVSDFREREDNLRKILRKYC